MWPDATTSAVLDSPLGCTCYQLHRVSSSGTCLRMSHAKAGCARSILQKEPRRSCPVAVNFMPGSDNIDAWPFDQAYPSITTAGKDRPEATIFVHLVGANL